jgi:CheY-like chemotaxis protein
LPVLNYFMAGQDLVTWNLMAVGRRGVGPFRLVVDHGAGCITEHFDTVAGALAREGELEALLIAARGAHASERIPLIARRGEGEPAVPGDAATRRLPAMAVDPELVSPKQDAPTILVVDDDQTVTETFALALQREGFNVRTAPNAETGLREAATHHADAIILDLRMPLINGIGFLYRLRGREEHRLTPVAIVTGAIVDDSMAAEIGELGAEVRFKPLWLEDVVQLARDLVSHPA